MAAWHDFFCNADLVRKVAALLPLRARLVLLVFFLHRIDDARAAISAVDGENLAILQQGTNTADRLARAYRIGAREVVHMYRAEVYRNRIFLMQSVVVCGDGYLVVDYLRRCSRGGYVAPSLVLGLVKELARHGQGRVLEYVIQHTNGVPRTISVHSTFHRQMLCANAVRSGSLETVKVLLDHELVRFSMLVPYIDGAGSEKLQAEFYASYTFLLRRSV